MSNNTADSPGTVVATADGSDSNSKWNIIEFDSFLESSLKVKVLEYTLKPLTKLGDNWSNTLLALAVKLLKNKDTNEVETLNLVCKIMKSGEKSEKSSRPFAKEIYFFSVIVPAFEHFEEMKNVPEIDRIDGFPRYFGSRFSLDPNAEKPNSDAVLLLENIKYSNYFTKDRKCSLEKDETMALLKKLAKMHALGIALRGKISEVFKLTKKPHEDHSKAREEILKSLQIVTNYLRSVHGIYPEKVLAAIEQQCVVCMEYILKSSDGDQSNDTPFTTITHHDLWITNFMIKKDGTGENTEIQAKILDFETCEYESFAHDLIYFLMMCVHVDDLKTNFKLFIEYYHSEFTKTLKMLNVPLDDYTYDKMWHEIKDKAGSHLVRVLFNIKALTASFDDSEELDEQSIQRIIAQPPSDTILFRWRCIIDLFVENEFI